MDKPRLGVLFKPALAALPGLFMQNAVAAVERQAGTAGLFDSAYIFQVLGSLLLVFGCIFGLVFLLRKMNGFPLASGAPIRVVASARVGSREKIILLEAGEQQLLVGVAAGNVRTLHVLDQPLAGDATTRSKTADFASLLTAARLPGK